MTEFPYQNPGDGAAGVDLAALKRIRSSEALLRKIEAAVSLNEVESKTGAFVTELPLDERIARLGERAAQVGELEHALASSRTELAEIRRGSVYRIALAVATAIRNPRSLVGWPGKLLRHMLPSSTAATIAPRPQFVPIPVTSRDPDLTAEAEVVPLLPAPGRPANIDNIRIAAICDPFTAQGLRPECQCQFLSPDTWPRQINSFRPHILFVESAWTGLEGEWTGMVSSAAPVLQSLVTSCRASGIPTLFWNKEDPLHFEAFLATAQLFDHVLTTDAESLSRYKQELGHERVHLLPFAVQPRLHHPVMQPGESRENASFFAGAWYGRHPERCRNFTTLADALALVGPLRIFDRNAGDADPMRRYPDRFLSCIQGSIDYGQTPAVHRQHRIGLTVNTIKNSSTMFARRAIELMACNTTVYSNHSRALSQLFGDLVIATDDGERVLELAFDEMRSPDALRHRVRRLAALRKVLAQYAWDDRVDRIAGLVWPQLPRRSAALVAVVSRADTPRQVASLIAMAAAQRGVEVSVWVDAPADLFLPDGIQRIGAEALRLIPDQVLNADLIAPWHADDLYGPHYLEDLVLARKFDQGDVIGKATYHHLGDGGCEQRNAGNEYRHVRSLALRRILMPSDQWPDTLGALLDGLSDGHVSTGLLLSIDGLSYLESGIGTALPEQEATERLEKGNALADVDAFVAQVASAPSLIEAGEGNVIDGAAMALLFNAGHVPAGTSATARRHRLELVSTLRPGRDDALFSGPIRPDVIERDGRIALCLDARPHPAIDLYLDELDASGRILRRDHLPAEVNMSRTRSEGVAAYRLAISLRGPFVTHLDGLWLQPRPAIPITLAGADRVLVVVNGYPSADNLYRNAFVHRRVLAYKALGVGVDVVCVSTEGRPGSFEYQGVSVVVCSPEALRASLRIARYRAIAVHFLDPCIWSAVQEAAKYTRTVVWLHGAEIQPWHRRAFNYRTDTERELAIAASEERMAFWRKLLADMPEPMHLVFVSHAFAAQTWEDLGLALGRERWSVIPNPIDTRVFRYKEKPETQRFKVLSIRPHASRIYANDLVAEAIAELSRHPAFSRMEFRLIGDGDLFEENFSCVRGYGNVRIERRFVSQQEAAMLYRDYGIFLVPTRGDTQGVSRDEAMASGMVPVTCAVGAIPEFVPGECGKLTEPDNASALAAAVVSIMDDPEWFALASRCAARKAGGPEVYEGRVAAELVTLGIACPFSQEARPTCFS